MIHLIDPSPYPPTPVRIRLSAWHTAARRRWPQKWAGGEGLKRNRYLRFSGFCFCKGWFLGERNFQLFMSSCLVPSVRNLPACGSGTGRTWRLDKSKCLHLGWSLNVQWIPAWARLASEVEVIKNQCYFSPFLFPLIWWAPRASIVIKK